MKCLESCFNCTVGIPLCVRIAAAKLAVLYVYITSCSHPRGSFPCHWIICSHSSALRQLSGGEGWKGSQRVAVLSLQGQLRAFLCALSASGMLELLSKALGVAVFTSALCTVSDQIIQSKTLYSFIMHKKHYLEKMT